MRNKPSPSANRKVIFLALPPPAHARATKLAADREVNIQTLLRMLLKEEAERKGIKVKK